jgi:hypothetical protein
MEKWIQCHSSREKGQMKMKKVAVLGGIVTAITAAAVYAIILTNESLKNIGDAFDVDDEDY